MTATPWGEALAQSLLNGPRTRENVLQSMMEAIPPGIAYRHWKRRLDYQRKNHVNKSGRHLTAPETPMEATIQSGRRDLATATLITALADERVFSFEVKGVQHLSLGKRIVRSGPVYKMAVIRCRQSHNWYDGIGEYEICHRWFEHVREALELFNASGISGDRKWLSSVKLPSVE